MISVILNVYKRPYTLKTQVVNILAQSIEIKPSDIHIWINTPEGGFQQEDLVYLEALKVGYKVNTYFCSHNTKFWGRFTLPLLCRTKYIAMFDDDVVCGKYWLEHCVRNIEIEDGILGGSGIIVHSKAYRPNIVVGWNGLKNEHRQEVDLVGHAWFFRKEVAKVMWMEEPPSWDNGEDMFFSYAAQKYMNLKTYVPPHIPTDVETWSNVPARDNNWGYDKNAHSLTHSNHIGLRNQIVAQLIDKGWKTVKNVRK